MGEKLVVLERDQEIILEEQAVWCEVAGAARRGFCGREKWKG